MNKAILLAIGLFSSALVFAQDAEFSFTEKTYKFDKIERGDSIVFSYKFVNTGEAPLVIDSIDVECTCTSLDYTYTAIAAGDTSTIEVIFDSQYAIGWQDRTLEIYANTKKKPFTLRFKVMVAEPKKE